MPRVWYYYIVIDIDVLLAADLPLLDEVGTSTVDIWLFLLQGSVLLSFQSEFLCTASIQWQSSTPIDFCIERTLNADTRCSTRGHALKRVIILCVSILQHGRTQ